MKFSATKSIVVTRFELDGTPYSAGVRGPTVRGELEVTHERPSRSEHWIIDAQGQRHLVYKDSILPS